MNVNGLKKALSISYEIKRPVLSLSSPGIGKSSAVYQSASELAGKYKTTFGVIELRAATVNPAEVADIKYIVDGEVKDAPQGWFPTNEGVKAGKFPERGYIYADELADSTLTVQSSIQRLLLDRKLGQQTLADGWHTTGSSNRASDKTAAGRLSTALVNRCIVVTVEPDTDVFIQWALASNIDANVIAFCRWRKSLWNFDPMAKNQNVAFCSPRSMHILSDIMKAESNPDIELITGTIGDGVGTEFSGFLQLRDELPDLDKILKDPDSVKVPKRADVAIATMYALMARMDGKKNIVNILKYLARNETELATMSIKDLCTSHPEIVTHKVVQDWMSDPQNYKLLSYGFTQG